MSVFIRFITWSQTSIITKQDKAGDMLSWTGDVPSVFDAPRTPQATALCAICPLPSACECLGITPGRSRALSPPTPGLPCKRAANFPAKSAPAGAPNPLRLRARCFSTVPTSCHLLVSIGTLFLCGRGVRSVLSAPLSLRRRAARPPALSRAPAPLQRQLSTPLRSPLIGSTLRCTLADIAVNPHKGKLHGCPPCDRQYQIRLPMSERVCRSV